MAQNILYNDNTKHILKNKFCKEKKDLDKNNCMFHDSLIWDERASPKCSAKSSGCSTPSQYIEVQGECLGNTPTNKRIVTATSNGTVTYTHLRAHAT